MKENKYCLGDVLLIFDNSTDERFVGIVYEIRYDSKGVKYLIKNFSSDDCLLRKGIIVFDEDNYKDDSDGEPIYYIVEKVGSIALN